MEEERLRVKPYSNIGEYRPNNGLIILLQDCGMSALGINELFMKSIYASAVGVLPEDIKAQTEWINQAKNLESRVNEIEGVLKFPLTF